MTWEDKLIADLEAQGIRFADVGLAYGRRAHPGLGDMGSEEAYSQGFLDGIRAFKALIPLLEAGPHHDPAEFWRRLYDPDVLPVGNR